MIKDEFETFCNDRFCKLKPEYIFKRKIHFLESRLFIQNSYSFFKNPEYSSKTKYFKIQNIPSKKLFISLKSRIFTPKNIHFSKRGRMGQG